MPLPVLSLRTIPGTIAFLGCGDLMADRFCSDSRRLQRGDVFVAVRGTTGDGHDFAAAAVSAGAKAVITERPLATIALPQCIVRDTRRTLAWLAMAQQSFPAEKLTLAGITGTNGKTTTAWLLRSILRTALHQTGLIGTIEYSDGRHAETAGLTTPSPEDLALHLRRMTDCGSTHCVMEVSSHALHQQRCSALQLATAAITNITRDHLDYHQTWDEYLRCKLLIAHLLRPGVPLLLGADDPGCRTAADLLTSVPIRRFGFAEDCQDRVVIRQSDHTGQSLLLLLDTERLEVRTALVGAHNALNALAAAALARQLQVPSEAIVSGLEQVSSVPGRMEAVNAGQAFNVFVDFAHTPDGLQQAVATLRPVTQGRLLVVFGAGGDRDREKRPLMAQAVETADVVVVTSDNPRSELPQHIVEEICSGFRTTAHVLRCIDRETAIRTALLAAAPGDTVLIAGRGHETLQQFRDRQIHFDDRRVTLRILKQLPTSPL
ncbi:MAG: UDP-N-acetylmuramoyl-L-alanyl-D-glutamate--2,6-diaminopimelate ligase [Planctomycetota bacterium]